MESGFAMRQSLQLMFPCTCQDQQHVCGQNDKCLELQILPSSLLTLAQLESSYHKLDLGAWFLAKPSWPLLAVHSLAQGYYQLRHQGFGRGTSVSLRHLGQA